MKKDLNKILLEAIHKGIHLALDDFDDKLIGQQTQTIKDTHYTKEYLDLMEEVVDLGLPSKTLWCKYNLGATCEPNNRSWFGKYYAWGELERNKTNENKEIYFDWDNYRFGKDFDKLTKYCYSSLYGLNGFIDNLTELLPEDDVAFQNKKLYNYKFHIPTKKQYEELINFTNSCWINNYDPNKIIHNPKNDKGIQGLNGRIFEGKNRNQLFIPAAGYRDDSDINGIDSNCYLWSSSLSVVSPRYAYNMYFNADTIQLRNDVRCFGFPIRPVINL